MILHNKKTGALGVLEATTYHGGRPDNIIEVYEMGMGAVHVLAQYNTLKELLEEWEDYEPKEPLIKDEKIRKAVRAWAEINLILDDDDVEASTPTVDCNVLTLTYGTISIDVFVNDTITIINHGHYTIAELCGEGEE